MILKDKYGWPVVFIKNRPITNIIRAIRHTNIRKTLLQLKPKLIKIEIDRNYFDGHYSATCTGTPHYYWSGYRHYTWFKFNWKTKLVENKHFEILGSTINFKFDIPPNVECIFTYTE